MNSPIVGDLGLADRVNDMGAFFVFEACFVIDGFWRNAAATEGSTQASIKEQLTRRRLGEFKLRFERERRGEKIRDKEPEVLTRRDIAVVKVE